MGVDKARAWDAVAKAHEDERAAIVAFMREAVDQGYPAPTGEGARSECEHSKFRREDCIACYDAHLHAKLDAIERREHWKARP